MIPYRAGLPERRPSQTHTQQTGPDTHLHGRKGRIIEIDFDDAGSLTGDSEDNFMYKVELDNGEIPDIHFRRHDLKRIES